MRALTLTTAIALALNLAGCSEPKPLNPGLTDAAQARPAVESELQPVYAFDHQITGVAVTRDNRIFVNFPRWTEDAPISVAEVFPDGSYRAYPNDEWNAWRNHLKGQMTPHNHFICVQSVVVDSRDQLWVLDPAAPNTDQFVPGGAKLVRIDPSTNQVAQVIPFDESIAPRGSYLNDVRISPDRNYAYITDSGKGAIIVVDLRSGMARRLLSEHPFTKAEPNVVVKSDGKPLIRLDGRKVEFASDGIALSPDGKTLYWQALTGETLYSIPTAALHDTHLTPAQLEARVSRRGKNGVADGLWIDHQGRMFITSPEDSSIKMRDARVQPQTIIQHPRLRWPDSFAQGADGSLYVTASHIQDSAWFVRGAPAALRTELFKIPADALK